MSEHPTPEPEAEVLFNEAGVLITRTHLTTPTHRFAFREIKDVTLKGPAGLALLTRKPFQFIVHDSKTRFTVFESKDPGLVHRIGQALCEAKGTPVERTPVE